MNVAHLAYRLVGNICATALIPAAWMRHAIRGDDLGRFYQRMGIYPKALKKQFDRGPLIWMHAVSVGEVGVALSVIRALRRRMPFCAIALSTATEQGMKRALAGVGDNARCFYAPIDLNLSVRLALQAFKPNILCLLETEIWPNLIIAADRLGVPTVVLNGRLSVRSIRHYRKALPLMRHTLAHITAFSMISDQDAERIHYLGAPAERVQVNGNAKFDSPDPYNGGDEACWIKALFNLHEKTPVFVAGSTRDPEELYILEAFLKIRAQFPQTVLIIAPRHTERVSRVAQWVDSVGLAYQYRTQLGKEGTARTAPVIILDTIGELSAVYSVATLVFCGGSLVEKGGQNVLEPALWAKPIIYGPSMEDFADARNLLERAGASVTVHNPDDIASVAIEWLTHPRMARSKGIAARCAVMPHRGAAQKHAGVIERTLSRDR